MSNNEQHKFVHLICTTCRTTLNIDETKECKHWTYKFNSSDNKHSITSLCCNQTYTIDNDTKMIN